MKKVTLTIDYTFDIAVAGAVRNAFNNAGLTFALREATDVIKTLSHELRETRQEYKNYINKTEKILSGLTDYREQSDAERKKIARDVVEYWFDKMATKQSPIKHKTIVYLSADNELYCEPKTGDPYRLETDSGRTKIIYTLMTHRAYVPTKLLVEISGLVSRKSLESAVQAINRISHNKLKITKLIDGYQDSGYRIHPDVILKKA